MARGDPQINLRLPGDMKDWIERRAERNVRSINGEIAFILLGERERETKTAGESCKTQPAE